MEDTGCTEEDYKLLDIQLEKCANYVLEHRHDLYWSMLAAHNLERRKTDQKSLEEDMCKGRCGSGSMPTLSLDGSIYPCFRWLPHTQKDTEKSSEMKVGDVFSGLNNKSAFAKVRDATRKSISPQKCLDCEFEPMCAYCVAGCFSEFGSFKRTIFICEIAKLMAKWTDYYWQSYDALENTNVFKTHFNQ